ncbi:MAG: hypothetical protein KC456_03080 [Flavobacteriales bacterium]|nr:hypothetical protein [Flavobacteriales bacterium]
MMYSFGQRLGCHIIDEPFYARYLDRTGFQHPGRMEVLNSMSSNWDEIRTELENVCRNNQEVFLKNMSHHLEDQFMDYLGNWKSVFLIRDPSKMIRSFSKVIHSPTIDDLGIVRQAEIFHRVSEEKGEYPLVVDADTFLVNPKRILEEICKNLDIAFSDSMLSWIPGPMPEDGIWAKYWYKNVHLSSGFVRPETTVDSALDPKFSKLLDEVLPYYHQLLNHQIKE